MTWHRGFWKCKRFLVVFVAVVSVLTAAFGSTRDFRVGVEDKCVFARRRQAQAYLDKAQETHKRVEVCVILAARRVIPVGY